MHRNSNTRLANENTSLQITPANWKIEDGELWDDLYDSIRQAWEKHNKNIVEKPFSFETWEDDFISLGFHSYVLTEFQRLLDRQYNDLGRDVVQLIMGYEKVGDIAELLLQGELDHYSRNHTNTDEQRDTAPEDAWMSGEVEQTSAAEQMVGETHPSAVDGKSGYEEN
jgi:hypothetical protein